MIHEAITGTKKFEKDLYIKWYKLGNWEDFMIDVRKIKAMVIMLFDWTTWC